MKRFPWLIALLLAALLATTDGQQPARAGQPADYLIEAVELERHDEQWRLLIRGNSSPVYTTYQLFDPPRLVVDIIDADWRDDAVIPDLARGPIREVRSSRTDSQPRVVQLEFILNADHPHDSQQRGNDILLTMAAPSLDPAPTGEQKATAEPIQPTIPPLREHTREPLDAEPEIAAAPAQDKAPDEQPRERDFRVQPPDAFRLADFERERISVDFHKTDLHNVFRLFGDIGNLNIVVDEAVSGTLSLSLNDVPWDFALDIILNLKDLQKKERFNTLVIAPRDKELDWGESGIEAGIRVRDGNDEERPAGPGLALQQRGTGSPEIIAAQNLIKEAQALERQGDHQGALAKYERAFQRWPDNGRLAEHLANLALVRLNLSAKAAHYARLAFSLDDGNDNAALLAAISLAQMARPAQAKEYFDHAIAAPRPAAEALLSYAAFAEEHNSPRGALALLWRHQELFGETPDSMMQRARLYDQLGKPQRATAEYRSLLRSGYELPDDLTEYIESRLAAAE